MNRRDLLIFALCVIKDECYEHDNCSNCPLWNDRQIHCGIREEVPSEWYLPDLFNKEEPIEPIF